MAKSYPAASLKIVHPIVCVFYALSESDALILLDRSLFIQLCLLGVHVGENTSTGFLIKLKNFVCDNILDAFFGQLV